MNDLQDSSFRYENHHHKAKLSSNYFCVVHLPFCLYRSQQTAEPGFIQGRYCRITTYFYKREIALLVITGFGTDYCISSCYSGDQVPRSFDFTTSNDPFYGLHFLYDFVYAKTALLLWWCIELDDLAATFGL